jgi:hypothetical protein
VGSGAVNTSPHAEQRSFSRSVANFRVETI